MKKIFKFVLLLLGFRYVLRLMDENVDIKIQIKKLRNELANLETDDLENKFLRYFNRDSLDLEKWEIYDEFENKTVLEFTNIKKNIFISQNLFVVNYK